MKMRLIWLVVSCWMVAALLLASCAPAAVKEEEKVAPPQEKKEAVAVPKEVVVPKEEANLVKWTGKKLDGTVVEIMKEKPRYGGTFTDFLDVEPTAAEEAVAGNKLDDVTNDNLIYHDWARGLSGTRDWGVFAAPTPDPEISMGGLATYWEIPEPDTFLIHIRKGVHWALDPTSEASRLVGGREMTADDVVFSLRRGWTHPLAFFYRSHKYSILDYQNIERSIYVSPTDKWAVVLKASPGNLALPIVGMSSWGAVLPPEVIQKYGDLTIAKWKHVVGTGPFMLRDYVGASALTYVRNPNHWMRDPFFPENQLPYVDTLRVLIIPDKSTRMAAIRTGKIDRLYDVLSEDAQSLLKTNPELKWTDFSKGYPSVINMNNAEKPFNDIRVRQALMMAINYRELTDVFYGGKAVLFGYPIPPTELYAAVYKPLEEMPQSVQELYGYHPDKAKQMLAEAGYPQGFKTDVITRVGDVDLLSIIKEYWAKIGVELKIDVRDSTVMSALQRSYKQMYMTTTPQYALARRFNVEADIDPGTNDNIDSPIAKEMRGILNTERYFEPGYSLGLLTRPLGEALPGVPQAQGLRQNWVTYANEQVWRIFLPEPYAYMFWQPWVKGYDGTYVSSQNDVRAGVARFLWIDQELKKAMGR